MDLTISPLKKDDFDQWVPLFEGYCRFYEVSVEDKKNHTVFGWLMDDTHLFQGLVASLDGKLVGLAHFHALQDSLDGTDCCYLSDLFVAPDQRGRDIGKQLFETVLKISKYNGWNSLTLLTHKTNKVGQNLYNQYGAATDYLFYSIENT